MGDWTEQFKPKKNLLKFRWKILKWKPGKGPVSRLSKWLKIKREKGDF